MYSLLKLMPIGELLRRQVPLLLLSLLTAELFYKFHSFTLECVAFLATWLALDVISQRLIPRGSRPPT